MSVRTDIVNLQVNINGNNAQNNLNELKKKAKDISFELAGLKKGTQEYIDKSKALRAVTLQMDALKKSIGITALSQKELVAELSKLKALRGSMTPFSAEFKNMSKEIANVESRLYDVKNGVKGFSSVMSKITDSVKQFGMATLAYLGFQFLFTQIQGIISGAGKLSDQLADLRRVTGLTADETSRLNKSLSEIDTRTSTSGLREIAIIAGKLGVQGVESLAAFTKATDQLVVALGDELGNAEEITSKLGKIINVFNGSITADGITKLGNAFVELANTGSATGAFIANFDQRLSGVAKSAGIGLGALSGLGAGLEEMGARVESSATAVQKLIISIASDLPAAAKIAGQSTETFNLLFQTDPTEAILKYSEGLVKNKQNFSAVTASLKDAGEEGARTVETISKLGANADILRKRIDLGTKSIQESTAITEAFNLKNQTFGATIDKLGKEFLKLVMSSGISNFFAKIVEGALDFLKIIKEIPSWINDNSTALKILTLGILVNNLARLKSIGLAALELIGLKNLFTATKLLTLATRAAEVATISFSIVTSLLSGNITKAKKEYQLLSLVIGKSPLGILLIALGTAALAFSYFNNKAKEASAALKALQKEQKLFDDIVKTASDNTAEQRKYIEEKIKLIEGETASMSAKKKAVADLIALDPKFLEGISLSNDGHLVGKSLIDEYIVALNKKALAEAISAKKTEAYSKITQGQLIINQNQLDADAQELINNYNKAVDKAIKNNSATMPIAPRLSDINQSTKLQQQKGTNLMNQGQQDLDALNNLEGKLNSILPTAKELKTTTDGIISPGASPVSADKNSDSKLEQLRKEAEAFAEELKKLRRDAENNTLTDAQKEIQIVQDKYQELIQRAKKYWAENTNIGQQKLAEILAIRDLQLQTLFKKQFEAGSEKEYTESLKNLDNFFEQERNKLGAQYANGILNKKQYEDGLKEIESRETNNRLIIAKDYASSVKKAAEDVTTFTAQQQKLQTTNAIANAEKKKQATLDEQMAAAKLKVLTSRPGSDSRLEAQKKLLQLQFDNDTEFLDKKSALYLEKAAELNNALAQLDEENNLRLIEQIIEYVNYAMQALDGLNRIITNRENAAFNKEKKLLDKRKNIFKKQLDDKLISQAQYDKKVALLEEQREAGQSALARKQAKREKALTVLSTVLSTAAAVAGALAAVPIGPWNIAQAAIFGLLGAIQIGVATSAPIPEMGRGGFLNNGPKHNSKQKGLQVINPLTGNTEMLLEQGEAVINARAMNSNQNMTLSGTPRQIASSLNSSYGGISFAGGASWMNADMPRIRPSMPRIMAAGGIINSAVDAANNANENMLIAQEIKGLRTDMAGWNKNLKSHVVLKEIQDTSNLYEAAKKASSISQ